MMNYIQKYKGIIIILVVLVGGFYVYTSFFSGAAPIAPQSGSVAVQFEQELLSELLSIQKIRLNEEIFSDSVFQTLHDFSQPLTPLPKGRENPFAPFVRQPSGGDLFTPVVQDLMEGDVSVPTDF